jgi:Fungal protein kinase
VRSKVKYIILKANCSGHWSLLEKGRILHRDISVHNIMISTSPQSPKGFLIDLDFAVEIGPDLLAIGPSGALHRTGTLPFISIGVLMKHIHTYRHDLESFFYVFVWLCIAYDGPNKRRNPLPAVLEEWSMGSYDAIARLKQGAMVRWEETEKSFSEYFYSNHKVIDAVRAMRITLFGENGADISTPDGEENRKILYRDILKALRS